MSDIEDGFCLPHNDTEFSSQPAELDKAIDQSERYRAKGWMIPQTTVETLLLAAKRLKEVEKENDEEIGKFQNDVKNLIDQMANSNVDGGGSDSGDWRDFTLSEISQGLAYVIDERDEIKKELHSLKTCDAVKFFNDLEQQISQLRAEYKRALKVINPEHNSAWCLKEFGHLCSQHAVLSTPSAIAAMKGEKE